MTDLVLHLKGEYFDQIARGEKPEEYRLKTSYWEKRLVGRTAPSRTRIHWGATGRSMRNDHN